jgi:hypothetical protein
MSNIDYYSKYKKYKTKYLLLQYGGLSEADAKEKLNKYIVEIKKIVTDITNLNDLKEKIFKKKDIQEFFKDIKNIDFDNNALLKTKIDKHKDAVKKMINKLIEKVPSMVARATLKLAIEALFIVGIDVIIAVFKGIIEQMLKEYIKMFPDTQLIVKN